MRVRNGSDESEIGIWKRPAHTVFKSTQTSSEADVTGYTGNNSTAPRKSRPQLCGVCHLDVKECERELRNKKREKACLDALNKRREEACGEMMFVLLLAFLGICTFFVFRAGGRDEQGTPVPERYRSVLARALGL